MYSEGPIGVILKVDLVESNFYDFHYFLKMVARAVGTQTHAKVILILTLRLDYSVYKLLYMVNLTIIEST